MDFPAPFDPRKSNTSPCSTCRLRSKTPFEFIRQNNENYRLLCKSNDFLFAAKKLTAIASGKLLELCHSDSRIENRSYIELELQIFLEGILCEYVKYCRGYSTVTLDDLYAYTKYWVAGFLSRRSAPAVKAEKA